MGDIAKQSDLKSMKNKQHEYVLRASGDYYG